MELPRRQEVSAYTTDELCDYLFDRVDLDAIHTLREQKISGLDFISPSDDDVKELFPVMGVRLGVSRAVKALREQNSVTHRSQVCINFVRVF